MMENKQMIDIFKALSNETRLNILTWLRHPEDNFPKQGCHLPDDTDLKGGVFKRISVRKFEDKPVEQEKIEQIMKAAMAAPSAGNQQPWEYYVVRDRETIEKLAECSPYSGCAAKAPVVIVPCLKTEGLHFPELGEIDLAITTENILLEITSLGLGGVWLAVTPFEDRMEKADAALGIGDKLHAFALVPVGYPAEDRPQQDRYDETRIHYIG